MIHHTLFSLVVCFATLATVPASGKTIAVQLGSLDPYGDVTYAQFERLGRRLRTQNPDLELIQLHRSGAGARKRRPSFELRELGLDLEPKLSAIHDPISLVVVQASAEDFDQFWRAQDRGENWFDVLRGRLAPNARIIFTGEAQDAGADRARALMTALGNEAGSMVLARTDAHVFATKRQLAWRGLLTAASVGLAGIGGTALTYIPREAIWADILPVMGALAWVVGEGFLKFKFGSPKTRTDLNPKEEFGLTEIVNMGQYLRGIGVSATVLGVLYSGPKLFNASFFKFALAYTGVITATYVAYNYKKILAYLAPGKFNLNRGDLYEASAPIGSAAVAVDLEDLDLWRCEDSLTTGDTAA